jgi:hypothetical protein
MYTPPPPPPPVYGSPYGGYGGREHPQGTTILVIGILSLVLGVTCGIGVLLGPVAWVMGNNAIAEIDRNPAAYTNRGQVQAGRICGIVATAFLILTVVLIIVIAVAAAAGSS